VGKDPERSMIMFAVGTGLRQSEQWHLHIADVHVDAPRGRRSTSASAAKQAAEERPPSRTRKRSHHGGVKRAAEKGPVAAEPA
jgi:hypothetical protein